MGRLSGRILPGVTILLFTLAASHAQAQEREAQQHLRDEYQGKTLVLRGFYSGNPLRFDAQGNLHGRANSGDWTVDGVVHVDDVRISRGHLKIAASRLHLGWVPDSGFGPVRDLKDEGKSRALQIEADLNPSDGASAAAAFSRIFLNSQDSFADLVPDYWEPCVRVAVGGRDDKDYQSCRFSREFLAVPGVALHSDSQTKRDAALAEPDRQTPLGGVVYHVRDGVAVPEVISRADPEFSDAARRAKFQGTVALKLVVGRDGLPTDIRIVTPLGCGLDANAVHAAERYRFKPAEKDGQPVAVEIDLENDFHMY